ncbi:MAG: HAD-IC family P-type ATPase, partial [Deltaproteobacteria bacterium]|nr:HAD-IC family P-type ATPase [Deltaproteobacteria bacterium]
ARVDLSLVESPLSWHIQSGDEVLQNLGASRVSGLSESAVLERRTTLGDNILPGALSRPFPEIVANQVKSLPVLLTGAAAGLSVITGNTAGGLFALGVALVNAAVGSVAEFRAEGYIEGIREAVDLRSRVLREGSVREVPFEEVVAGDILDLQVGSRIAADARLLEAHHLNVDESTLTGESVPVEKSVSALRNERVPVSQRRNMVFRGTLVVEGSGRAVAVATGSETVLGRLQAFLGEVFPPEAVMARELKGIAGHLIRVGLGACGILAGVSLLRGQGLLRIAREGLSFMAGAFPSGLSTLAVSAFALRLQNTSRQGILVRRLRAVGNLASAQVVCFDKTGTLTHNRMTVTELSSDGGRLKLDNHDPATRREFRRVAKDPDVSWLITLAAICNAMTLVQDRGRPVMEGSPTEKALVHLTERAGLDPWSIRESHPVLETTHRTQANPFMMTLHRWADGRRLTAMKGSPLDVLERCSHRRKNGRVLPLGDEDRLRLENENFRMAGGGLRVLGMAYRWEGPGRQGREGRDRDGFVWAGLIGLRDPVRKEAKELILSLHRAGIRTAVITGDQSLTAQHIGEELGLSGQEPLRVLDVLDIRGLEGKGLKSVVTRTHVFARLNPLQKLRIIQAYQRAGMNVVMVGDGVNDVLALRVADVGISMGQSGTELARSAADLVLEEDDLRGVLAAVANGRAFHENMRRSLRFLLTSNQVNLMIDLPSRTGMISQEPGRLQDLWRNLVCLSLASDTPGPGLMERPPADPAEGLTGGGGMGYSLGEALRVIGAAAPVGLYGLVRHGAGSRAGSLFLTSVSMNEMLYALRCAEEDGKGVDRAQNAMLGLTLAGALGFSLLSVVLPGMGSSFGSAAWRILDVAALGLNGLASWSFLQHHRASPGRTTEEES